MKNNNLLDVTDEVMEKNIVTLIEDEDLNISGAGTPAGITVVITIGGLLQVTTACTSRCWRP